MADKSLSKNAIYSVVYKCLNVLFPLVTMMYVSRVLLPEGVGKVASAQNIVSYFVIVASLGLPTYGVKKIAELRDNREQCSKIFSELFTVNAISTVLCSAIYVAMVFSANFFHPKIAICLVVGIQLFANIINIDWLYQGFEEYRYIMLRSLFVKLLALVSVFAFVHKSSDYIIYALITALSLVANFVFNVVHMHKYVDITFKKLCLQRHVKPLLTLLSASIAIEIYTLCDTTFLTVSKGNEIVAYFTNSSKAIAITRTMIAAACAVFLPRLNYYIGQNRIEDFNKLAIKGLRLLLSISVPTTIILALLADDFVCILFGNEYSPSIISMQILSISVITVTISNFMGYQILVSLGKEKTVFISTIIAVIVNVILNILLIDSLCHVGAAIASVVAEAAVAFYQLYYVSKCIPLDGMDKLAKSVLIPSAAMFCAIVLLKSANMNTIMEVTIATVVGAICYFFTGKALHNDTVSLISNKISIIKKKKN